MADPQDSKRLFSYTTRREAPGGGEMVFTVYLSTEGKAKQFSTMPKEDVAVKSFVEFVDNLIDAISPSLKEKADANAKKSG